MKYLESNLVFGHEGEVWAYYEWEPYNYSFISEDKAVALFRRISQLIGSSQAEKLHFLMIATEESIKSIIERSKGHIRGRLSAMAGDYMDGIREHLEKRHGRYIVGYRSFIGFKLSLEDAKISRESFAEEMKQGFRDMLQGISGGDYWKIDNEEISRYLRLEERLYHKIARSFRFRRTEAKDMAYIIKHLNCEEPGDYKAYAYAPEVIVEKGVTRVKSYDVLRLADCVIKEEKRHLNILTEDRERKAAYLALSDMTAENVFPFGAEVLYYMQEAFDFPVDTSIKIEVLSNLASIAAVRGKRAEMRDVDLNAAESGSESEDGLLDALSDAGSLSADLEKSKEDMYKISYLVRVAAGDEEILAKRVAEVKDFYRSYNMLLQRPFGDMAGLHGEFFPTTPRFLNDYVHYVKSDWLASLGFGAIHRLGDGSGIYLGYEAYTGHPVFVQPWRAAQGEAGTVTNALAKAFLGSLGGGKSVSMNLLTFYSVLFGGRAFVLDPKGERISWKEDLAFLGDSLNIINVKAGPNSRGLCDPFQILEDKEDAKFLALDILAFLTGCTVREGGRFAILTEHVGKVAAYADGRPRGLLHVIRELKETGTKESKALASHIEAFSDLGISSLLFGDGEGRGALRMDRELNVVLVQNLSLPDSDTPADKYTMSEALSIAILLVLSSFAMSFINQDRDIYKVVDLDEAWAWLQVPEGKAVSNKLVRAGRQMNAGIDFATQNCADLLDERMKNNIGMKLAFRSRDKREIEKTLDFMGLDQTEANIEALQSLNNGECLCQDINGHVGVLHVDYAYPHLLQAFDTRPPVA